MQAPPTDQHVGHRRFPLPSTPWPGLRAPALSEPVAVKVPPVPVVGSYRSVSAVAACLSAVVGRRRSRAPCPPRRRRRRAGLPRPRQAAGLDQGRHRRALDAHGVGRRAPGLRSRVEHLGAVKRRRQHRCWSWCTDWPSWPGCRRIATTWPASGPVTTDGSSADQREQFARDWSSIPGLARRSAWSGRR